MEQQFTVSDVLEKLLDRFPASDAEPWDKTGLILGDPQAVVTGVAVALDPTIPALEEAQALGANVLVTHHPPFLKAPETYLPADSIAAEPGALVLAAAQKGIALICFHTAFDNSIEALHLLPETLGLIFQRTLLPLNAKEQMGKGYGAVCAIAQDAVITVGDVAKNCERVFGRKPRVWGDPCAAVCSLVTAQGSAAEAGYAAVGQGIDCLVCGEMKYHDALPLSQAGLAVIELGHDVSELPLAHYLAETVRGFGVENVTELNQNNNWTVL